MSSRSAIFGSVIRPWTSKQWLICLLGKQKQLLILLREDWNERMNNISQQNEMSVEGGGWHKCKKCHKIKPFSAFPPRKDSKLWIRNDCRDCRRDYHNTPERRQKSREYEEKRYTNHKRKLYLVRQNATYRCTKPFNVRYHEYWARWIQVERKTFDSFYADMLPSYLEHIKENTADRKWTQLDRIDVNWNYKKENCRRVTAEVNARNKQ